MALPLSVAAGAKAFRNKARKGAESRHPPAPIGQRNVDQVRQRLLQDHSRARVRRSQPECIIESQHSRRKIGQDAFEIGSRRLDGAMAFLALLFRFGKLRRHGVERFRKHAELIAALDRMTAAEVSLCDCSRTFGEQPQRLTELLG